MKFKAVVFQDGMKNRKFHVQMKHLTLEENKTLPVYYNFDRKKPIGSVKLVKNGEYIVGDFEITDRDQPLSQLYPAIGGSIKEDNKTLNVECVGLSITPNRDERIQRLPVFAKDGKNPPSVT